MKKDLLYVLVTFGLVAGTMGTGTIAYSKKVQIETAAIENAKNEAALAEELRLIAEQDAQKKLVLQQQQEQARLQAQNDQVALDTYNQRLAAERQAQLAADRAAAIAAADQAAQQAAVRQSRQSHAS